MRSLVLALASVACASCGRDAAPPAPDAAPAPRGSPFESFDQTAPKVGDPAPGFELMTLDGAVVKLSDATARGPVVLVSGSFSCPLFRMKVPRFEELAARWRGKAELYYLFSEEAHPEAASSARLQGFAQQVAALDADGDEAVTVAEYGVMKAPRYMFDAFDVDRDGVVRSHELIAARRIDQFQGIQAPKTLEERVALAKRFRTEVPGMIRVLIDPLDHPVGKAYGGLPNSAHVIDKDGRVTFKLAWAAVGDVERELARLTGAPPPLDQPPDLTPLRAHLGGKPVIVELVAPGCAACKRMDDTTLADPEVQKALGGHAVVRLSVDEDAAWRLFEDLELGGTPAFVHVAPDGTIGDRLQGFHDRAAFLAFLGP